MSLPYYKMNRLIPYFSEQEGARIVREVSLSLDRAPPILEEPKPPPASATKKPKPQPGDGLMKMLELHTCRSQLPLWIDGSMDRGEAELFPHD